MGGTRHATPVRPRTYDVPRRCWAFLVGISRYKQSQLNLQFAHRDAAELAQQLRQPCCGAFAPDDIVLLCDEEATTARVIGELRVFLQKPAPEDLVILYFACHGSLDVRRPSVAYLVMHDTDVGDLARTGLLMREVIASLNDYLAAQRVVLFADTCHSGALAGVRGISDSTAVVNRYLDELAKSRPGVAVFTSAHAGELAQENARWGGGHGVFTHFLLEGLRGQADRNPRNFMITIDELFRYVSENVSKETRNQQRPCTGSAVYDPDLVLSCTAGIAAHDQCEIGMQLLRMGRLLDYNRCYDDAQRELKRARRAAENMQSILPEAELGIGLAMLLRGDAPGAAKQLSAALAGELGDQGPDLRYYCGVAHFLAGEDAAARSVFTDFTQLHSADDRVGLAGLLATWLGCRSATRHRALLIGVSRYQCPALYHLDGPATDVRLMRDALINHCGFAEDDIVMVSDENEPVTRDRIVAKLRELAQASAPEDVNFIYFSGHALPEHPESYLCAYDTVASSFDSTGEVKNAVTAREFHELLENIRSASKTVILDTHPNRAFIDLARGKSTYAVLLASSPGDNGAFSYFFDQGGTQVPAGLMTYVLVQALAKLPPGFNRSRLMEQLVADVHTRKADQTPFWIGVAGLPFVAGDAREGIALLLRTSLRRNYAALELEDLSAFYEGSLLGMAVPFPELHLSVGRAYLEKGQDALALAAIGRAQTQSRRPGSELWSALTVALLRARRYDQAAAAFDSLCASVQVGNAEFASAELGELLLRLQAPGGRALLIGIDRYAAASPILEGPEVSQAPLEDLLTMRRILIERLAFKEDQIVILRNEQATRAAILTAFSELCTAALKEPAIFYFAGNGSVSSEGQPTLLSWDGRMTDVFDLSLGQLAALCTEAPTNLVSVLDADFAPAPNPESPPARFVARDLRAPIGDATTEVVGRRRTPGCGIGRLTIRSAGNSRVTVEAADAKLRQRVREALASAPADRSRSTLAMHLAAAFAVESGARLPWDLAGNLVAQAQAEERVVKVEREPIARAARLLRNLLEQCGGEDPDQLTSLAVAYDLLGNHDAAIDLLRRATSLCGESCHPSASYHLGRILVEQRRHRSIGLAETELKRVVENDATDSAACYYLGRAIQAVIEGETLSQVETYWQRYLNLGAPLGCVDEVRTFLLARRSLVRPAGQRFE